ncbi:sulfurtransferase [Rhodococcus sp. NPDC058521]|uniref:sulfurtransferase n=1 Tax=Rhodococcus sp. NPDC058521 TaxID=3346536 RepID=UPI0036589051
MSNPVVIDAGQLAELVESTPPPVILDVRWALGDSDGAQHYLDGHVPGAVFVDLDIELADPPSTGRGRHPLPALDRLQAVARTWGIDDSDTVVVYDATGNLAAARAWWLLRWGGLTDVRLLDGGVDGWTDSGRELAVGPGEIPAPGTVTLTGGGMPVIGIDEAASWPERGSLLDARAAERFTGETEPVDPRAGHIPGAVNLPAADNIDDRGRFKSSAALSERFADVRGPVAVYCGSGVNAAQQIASLEIAGIDAALFPGSWSQWSNDDEREVAVGA